MASHIDGALVLEDGDTILVKGKRSFNRQTLGTVSGSARQYRENETAAIDKAQERGHKLVFLFANAVIIAADPSSVDRSYKAEVEPGEMIYVDSPWAEERGFYTVELPRPRHLDGDHCRLVPVEQDECPDCGATRMEDQSGPAAQWCSDHQ